MPDRADTPSRPEGEKRLVVPPMTFRVEDLMNADAMVNGPFVVYWGQESEIEVPDKPMARTGRPPKLRERLRRCKRWLVDIRLQPAPDQDLMAFGADLAKRLGIEMKAPAKPENKAIWLPGDGYYRNAPEAIGAAGRLLQMPALQGVRIVAAQVWVRKASLRSAFEEDRE